MSELRWNPLLGEWVATAHIARIAPFSARGLLSASVRPSLAAFPTEVPEPDYDIVSFQNRFPSLRPTRRNTAVEGSDLYPVRPPRAL